MVGSLSRRAARFLAMPTSESWSTFDRLPEARLQSVLVSGTPERASERLQQILKRCPLAHRQHRLDGQARAKLAVAKHRTHPIELRRRHDDLDTEVGLSSLLVGETIRGDRPNRPGEQW